MMNQIKILFSLFSKLDYRDKNNSGKKKMTGIMIAYLFSNFILSYNFHYIFDEKSYVILTFTSCLFMSAFIVLNDFENLFLANRSFEVLNTLPVRSKNLFISKFLSAVLYILFFTVCSAAPQTIFFYLFEHNAISAIQYAFTNMMFCFSVLSILILFYIVILKHFPGKANLMLNFIQIIFFIFIFYSTSLSSGRTIAPGMKPVKINIADKGFAGYLPQTFFSKAVYSEVYFIACLMIFIFLILLLYFTVSGSYASLAESTLALNRKKTFKISGFKFTFFKNAAEKYLLSGNYETASYNLAKNQIRNSRFLKLKYFPLAFMPLVLVIVGILSGLPQLLFFNKTAETNSFFNTAYILLSPSITLTLLMSSRLLISNTKIMDENTSGTEWIYESLPMKEKGSAIKGANKFIYINYMLPVVLLIYIMLCFITDIVTVSLNIFFISASVYFINSVSLLFDKVYPFTLESTKFNSASKFIEIFIALIIGVALFLIQIFVFQNIIFVSVSTVSLLMLSYLINKN